MQIIEWLSKKIAHEPPTLAIHDPLAKKRRDKDGKVKVKNVVVVDDGGVRRRRIEGVEQSKLSCEDLNLFYFIRRKDVSKECFYHTLNLRRVGSVNRRQHSVRSIKEDATNHGGNRVLPLTETVQASSKNNNSDRFNIGKINQAPKGEKPKRISRMKELIKWASTAKTEKRGNSSGRKVLFSGNRRAQDMKAVEDDDQHYDFDSPKISFTSNSERFSTVSSASLKHNNRRRSLHSTPLHVPDQSLAKTENWITNDSEFVVLEL